jgi:hypothetical protein
MKNYQFTTKNYQIGSKMHGRKETTKLLPIYYQFTTINYQIGNKVYNTISALFYYENSRETKRVAGHY